MKDRTIRPLLWQAAMLACVLPTLGSAQQAGGEPAEELRPRAAASISIELNKLEQTSGACHAYFVVENETPHRVAELQIDVFVFDNEGLILRRIALTFQDIRANRTKVVIFDLADVACGDIGRLLVNEIITCTDEKGGALQGCGDLLTTRARAEAEFAY